MPKRPHQTRASSDHAPQEATETGDEVLEAIGQRVREARLAAGLTGNQLADKVGCSVSWIYSLEGGLQNFTYAMFRRVCDALGVDFRQVLIAADEIRARQTHDRLVALAHSSGLKLGALNKLLAGDVGKILAELSSINDEGRALLELDDAPVGSTEQGRARSS